MSTAKKYDVFQAIADPTRRKMLQLLAENELAISDISKHFPMSRTAVSKHLHILSEAKLIVGEKVGREKRYTFHPAPLAELKDWLAYYDRFWDNKLSILQHIIANEDIEKGSDN